MIRQGSLDSAVSRQGTEMVIEQVDGQGMDAIEGTVEVPRYYSVQLQIEET